MYDNETLMQSSRDAYASKVKEWAPETVYDEGLKAYSMFTEAWNPYECGSVDYFEWKRGFAYARSNGIGLWYN